jgi:hypothetical protein
MLLFSSHIPKNLAYFLESKYSAYVNPALKDEKQKAPKLLYFS